MQRVQRSKPSLLDDVVADGSPTTAKKEFEAGLGLQAVCRRQAAFGGASAQARVGMHLCLVYQG